MYWIYDIPNWQLFLLMVSFFIAVSVIGLFVTRPFVHRVIDGSAKHNDITSYYINAVGVLYGLTLGLIAVGTWQNFSDADSKASREANSLGALYRDLDGYPTELRIDAENMLRDYTKVVIEKEWPAHRKGEFLDTGDLVLEELENRIMDFEPTSESQKIFHAAVIKSLNDVVENRGFRIQSVQSGLPGVLWTVVLIGAVINIGLSYLFWVENIRLHALLIAALSSMLGILIFLTAAMDNPYRGEFSVSPDAFQYSLDHIMTKSNHPDAKQKS